MVLEIKRSKTIIVLFVIMIVVTTFFSGCIFRNRDDPNTEIRSIEYDGFIRTYRVHIPRNYDSSVSNALVFVLHGGSGSGENMENGLTQQGFNTLARKNNLIVAYPDGIDNRWNDGRQNLTDNQSFYDIDDVGFLTLLIDALSDEFKIKNNNVFF